MNRVRVTLEMRLSSEGSIQCGHWPSTSEDRRVLESWPSGGLVHLAQSLLVEAIRRESYTMAISLLSSGKPLSEVTPKEIEDLTRIQVLGMLDKIGKTAADDVYRDLTDAENLKTS